MHKEQTVSEKVEEVQVALARECEEERHYWWIEDCGEWLEGKESRAEYYTRLAELASLRG